MEFLDYIVFFWLTFLTLFCLANIFFLRDRYKKILDLLGAIFKRLDMKPKKL